jgi:hypothetical protein
MPTRLEDDTEQLVIILHRLERAHLNTSDSLENLDVRDSWLSLATGLAHRIREHIVHDLRRRRMLAERAHSLQSVLSLLESPTLSASKHRMVRVARSGVQLEFPPSFMDEGVDG